MSRYLTEVEVRNILVSGIVESLRSIPEYPENAGKSTKRFYKERADSIKDDLTYKVDPGVTVILFLQTN